METKLFQATEGPCLLNSHVSKNICELLLAQSPPPCTAALPPPKTGEETRSPSHCSFQAQKGINKNTAFPKLKGKELPLLGLKGCHSF